MTAKKRVCTYTYTFRMIASSCLIVYNLRFTLLRTSNINSNKQGDYETKSFKRISPHIVRKYNSVLTLESLRKI